MFGQKIGKYDSTEKMHFFVANLDKKSLDKDGPRNLVFGIVLVVLLLDVTPSSILLEFVFNSEKYCSIAFGVKKGPKRLSPSRTSARSTKCDDLQYGKTQNELRNTQIYILRIYIMRRKSYGHQPKRGHYARLYVQLQLCSVLHRSWYIAVCTNWAVHDARKGVLILFDQFQLLVLYERPPLKNHTCHKSQRAVEKCTVDYRPLVAQGT